MINVNLTGNLQVGGGPGCGCDGGSLTSIPLNGTCGGCGESFACSSGAQSQTLVAPTYQALSGIGETAPVTKATLFALYVSTAMLLRLTTYALPDPIVAVIPISGQQLLRFPAGSELILAELQGSGQIQYFAAGQQ